MPQWQSGSARDWPLVGLRAAVADTWGMIKPATQNEAPGRSGTEYIFPPSVSADDSRAAGEQRQCPLCLCWRPTSQFRVHRKLKGKLYRAGHCNECHRQRQRARRREHKTAEDRRIIHGGWASLAKHKEKRLTVLGIVEPLWKRFGGSAGIAAVWHEALLEASATKRVRACEALCRLTEWLTEHPDVLTDATIMDDDELASELREARIEAATQLIRDEPDVAAAVAKQLGYRLTPAE